MQYIKLIKDEADHQLALSRLMSLIDIDPKENTADHDELELLSLLIEKYEEKAFPIARPDPIDAIRFRMDQQGLIKKDLIPYIGSAPKVTEVLNGTRNLSLNMIRKLSEGLAIPAEILIQEPKSKKLESVELSCTS